MEVGDLDDHASDFCSHGGHLGGLVLRLVGGLSQDQVDVGVDEGADEISLGGLVDTDKLRTTKHAGESLPVVRTDIGLSCLDLLLHGSGSLASW